MTSFSRFPVWRRWFGLESERIGARYLRRLGFRIVGRNVLDGLGEIDLLALDGDTLVIVEVRSSASRTFGELAATINADKQRRLTDAAARFVQSRRLGSIGVRFDVLAVRRLPGMPVEIRHYRNAFPATGRFQMGR